MKLSFVKKSAEVGPLALPIHFKQHETDRAWALSRFRCEPQFSVAVRIGNHFLTCVSAFDVKALA